MESAITYDTIICPCVKCSTLSNRLRALESSPVLRTWLQPNSSEEQKHCSEKGGEMGVRLGLATRDLTTPSGDTQEPEVVEEHRVSMTARCYSIRIPNSRLQELHHLDSNSEQFGSKESIKEETPVGLRTRSMIQQQHPTAHKDVNENGPEGPIEPEIKELLLQLIAQNKEQQDEMKHLRLALKQGLEQQESIVRELKEDIAVFSMKSQEKKQLKV
jgi:hypothetical protein